MAKTTAPLFSFTASGAIAKSLVYFPWKGLAAVRKYVVPTNPNTTAQSTHRAFLTQAVAKIHLAMADATYPVNSADRAAYSLWGTVTGKIMTWFNTITKMWVEARVASLSACIFSGGSVTAAATQLTLALHITAAIGAEPTTGKIHYGQSKTQLISSVVCTIADLATGKAVTGLTNGLTYYLQYRPTTAGYTTSYSGIYHGIPKA